MILPSNIILKVLFLIQWLILAIIMGQGRTDGTITENGTQEPTYSFPTRKSLVSVQKTLEDFLPFISK